MLDFDPATDQPTPRAIREMHLRLVCWIMVGVCFAFAFAVAFGMIQPAKAAEPRTSSWAATVQPLPTRNPRRVTVDKSVDAMLRDINAERARTTAKLDAYTAEMVRRAAREAAQRELNSLLYQLDARDRHSRGIVNPDEL